MNDTANKRPEVSPEQATMLEIARKHWLAIGRSTEPCNRAEAEAAMTELYAQLDKPAPPYYWVESPLSACSSAPIIAATHSLREKLKTDETLKTKVAEAVQRALTHLEGMTKSLPNGVVLRQKLHTLLMQDLDVHTDPMLDTAKRLVMNDLLAQTIKSTSNDPKYPEYMRQAYNSYWTCWWCAYFAHCHELKNAKVIEIPEAISSKLDTWIRFYKHMHFTLIFENFCIMSERPTQLHVDDTGRLHNDTGPALAYKDGYALYSVNGVRVPEKVIMNPTGYTKEELIAETNSEVHRVLGERLGWEKYLDILGATVVDTWIDPNTELKYELCVANAEIADAQPKWLKMKSPKLWDGSQPTYVEPVHPDLLSAQSARKWQIQLSHNPNAKYHRHGDVVLIEAEPDTLYWPTPEECNANPELVYESER